MSCLLYVDDEEAQRKLNIDDLYEKKDYEIYTFSHFKRPLYIN